MSAEKVKAWSGGFVDLFLLTDLMYNKLHFGVVMEQLESICPWTL